jgi:uncharacterized protein (TIGR03435 family)
MQNGGEMPKLGAHVDGARAEYTYMALRELIVLAYKVKPFQITGPDWMVNTRFDIQAKMPDGSKKDDAPEMLQSLLEDRFKLTLHRETKEHAVLALVVGKGGPKLKESEAPKPIDENAPLKPGEVSMDTAEGPVRMKADPKNGTASVDMGAKGKYTYKMDPGTMTMHLEATQVTMSGFADMLSQFLQMQQAGGGAKTVVDMTELKGNYQVAFDFSLADLMAMARAAGADIPAGMGGAPGGVPAGAPAASEPSGGSTITEAVIALGLKLEQRRAPVEQIIIDHLEKTPTGN